MLPADRIQLSAARGVGNVVVLLGAKTGRDGIGGVSVLASATFDEDGPAKRPAVQVGDPFTEKLLIESCLEMFDAGLVAGIQDLGGAGLTCALTETTAAGRSGMRAHLDRVPLREASMEPHEVLASESQERMLAIVEPGEAGRRCSRSPRSGACSPPRSARSSRATGSWSLWHGETVVDVPPGSLADDGPVYERPMARPADLDALRAAALPAYPAPDVDLLLRMVASPNLCSRRWVIEQYDRVVLGNTVLAWPEDAGVVRLSEETGLGVALATDGNGRYTRLDPYAGAQLALAEAYRNVAATGAVPIAVTNCLNFGSPEDPEVMWQFAEATRGLADGCRALGIPVTGGNVSFYNSDRPAPRSTRRRWSACSACSTTSPAARRWASSSPARCCCCSATPPTSSAAPSGPGPSTATSAAPRRAVDLAREQLLGDVLVAGSRDGMLSSAHDLSDGGLAQALVEAALRERRRRPGGAARRSRPVRAAVQRVGRPGARHRAAQRGAALHRDVQRPRPAVHPDRRHRRHQPRRPGPVRRCRSTELREAHERTLPALFGPLAGGTADDPAGPARYGPPADPGARQPDLG